MFRSNGICCINCLVHVFGNQDIAKIVERLLDDLFSGKNFDKTINFFADFCRKFFACGNQDCGSKFVVFCLRKKVCSYISRISSFIGKNKNLTWSCNGINADISIYGFFGESNKNIARSYDLVNFRDTFCTVGKSTDRLCTADFVDFISTGFFCGNKCGRIYFTVFSRRGGHNDLVNTCNFGRYDVHKNGGRIYCLATRYIYTDSFKGSYFLTEHGSVCFAGKPAVLSLLFVIASDIDKCFTDDIDQRRIHSFISFFDLFFGDFDRICGNFSFVKFFSIGKKGGITFCFYFVKNLINGRFEFAVVIWASFQEIFQNIFCTFFCKCYCTHCAHPFCFYLSITFRRSRIRLRIRSSSIFMLT